MERALRFLGLTGCSPEQRRLDHALALRKAERLRNQCETPDRMQVAARKGAATKRRQRIERDPLMRERSRAS
jgi:hypothetical protein